MLLPIAIAQVLQVLAGDVGYVYLNEETKEEIYGGYGPEFGPTL
jgi:hypothetical protein